MFLGLLDCLHVDRCRHHPSRLCPPTDILPVADGEPPHDPEGPRLRTRCDTA
ncbi:hypothetical protein ACFPM0_17300 [Pseudonocardia sulfidoxydans]|uniref:hypothetical protein n=1 Tax=Pseudonocardia sulfidoxydans TaxID=54011 RepID=UPI003616FE7A